MLISVQGMEIGYRRAERLGRSYSEYGDEPAQPSDAGCAHLPLFGRQSAQQPCRRLRSA